MKDGCDGDRGGWMSFWGCEKYINRFCSATSTYECIQADLDYQSSMVIFQDESQFRPHCAVGQL